MGEAILIGFGLFCLLIVVSILVKIFYNPEKCNDCKTREHYYCAGQPLPEETRKCTCNKKPS